MIINTRTDLDALAGTDKHKAAIRLINSSRLAGNQEISRLGFNPEDWDTYMASAGLPLGMPEPTMVPDKTASELRAELKQQLAARRYAVETGGISVDGVAVATDRQSQAMLLGALIQLPADATVDWKCADGSFRRVTRDQLAGIARGVTSHVQACFSREAELCALIDLVEDLPEYSSLVDAIEAFWPASF